MGRPEDAARLKVLSERMAVLREELARLRAERDEIVGRLRTLPGRESPLGRVAVKVAYGEAGEGLFLADLPGVLPTADRAPPSPPKPISAVETDVKDD